MTMIDNGARCATSRAAFHTRLGQRVAPIQAHKTALTFSPKLAGACGVEPIRSRGSLSTRTVGCMSGRQ
jgi:hypothetical protein